MAALFQHNDTGLPFGSLDHDFNGTLPSNGSLNTRMSGTGTYHERFHWSIMAATVAIVCQTCTLFWSRTAMKRMCRHNLGLAFILMSLMIAGLPLTVFGTIKKHLNGSAGSGESDICIVCGVVLSLVAHVCFIIYPRRSAETGEETGTEQRVAEEPRAGAEIGTEPRAGADTVVQSRGQGQRQVQSRGQGQRQVQSRGQGQRQEFFELMSVVSGI